MVTWNLVTTTCVKKITAILFLFLFAFNWFGYRLVYDYLQHESSQNLEALLDNDFYNEDQLVEFKVPMQHLAYQNSNTSFERFSGEIEINGTIYKCVKRKISNDTLFLVCIVNTKKMHLESAKNNFFKISNDLEQNNSKSTDNSVSVFKNFQPVFNPSLFGVNIMAPSIIQENLWLSEKSELLPSSTHISPEQPPDLIEA